jgi:type II secretory pathway pseudopilin PulG
MKNKKNNFNFSKKIHIKQNGFSLLEMLASVTLLIVVLVLSATILSKHFQKNFESEEKTKLTFIINQKIERIRTLGFWIWDVDTQSPQFAGNAKDPAVEWGAELSQLGIDRGQIAVTFLKVVNDELANFNGQEFDGNYPRNKANLKFTLTLTNGISLSREIVLYSFPAQKKLRAIMYIIKQALEIYYTQNSNYPPSNELNLLVGSILAEIPNDPYTEEQEKLSHLEEIGDWYYENNAVSSQITLSPESNRDISLQWNY